MIADLAKTARLELVELVSVALVFGALAYVTKRDAIIAGIRRARPEFVTNLALLLINALVFIPLIAAPVLTGWTLIPQAPVLVAIWKGLPPVAAILGAIFCTELAAYWRHRFEHSRALWRVHATHHADEAMTG